MYKRILIPVNLADLDLAKPAIDHRIDDGADLRRLDSAGQCA